MMDNGASGLKGTYSTYSPTLVAKCSALSINFHINEVKLGVAMVLHFNLSPSMN
jgi:hypothetical protein